MRHSWQRVCGCRTCERCVIFKNDGDSSSHFLNFHASLASYADLSFASRSSSWGGEDHQGGNV